MVGKNSWTCTARNSVDGRMYEDEITANFEAASQIDACNMQYKIPLWLLSLLGTVAGCLVGITIGLLASHWIKDKHKSLKGSTSRKKSTRGTESEESEEMKLMRLFSCDATVANNLLLAATENRKTTRQNLNEGRSYQYVRSN